MRSEAEKGSTCQQLATGVAKLKEFAAERGRATPSVTLGTHAILGDDDAARSANDAMVRDMIDTHGVPPDEAARIPVTGSPQHAAERFADYAAAGADRLVIAPNDMDWMQQSALIAEAHDLLGSHHG